MKQFILNGDIVKRLLYNKPINDEDYEQDFSTWIINENQPSDGITVTKNKISISKFKPNEWIIKSNYDEMNQANFLDKFYNKDFTLSGLDEARDDNKISVVLDNPTGNTSQTYHAYGLVISPVNSNGVLMTHVYPWDMNIPNGYFKNAVGYYNSWNVYGYSKNETKKLYNWSCYWANYNQVAFAIYTSVATDVDGFIELNTPIEISVPNIAIVDPTTQEVFKLYNKNELLYERDKTVENLYSVYGILLNATMIGFNNNDIVNIKKFTNENDEYQNISLPVAIDLVSKIQAQEQIKFNIRQFDTGLRTNRFWETVINAINNLEITNALFAKRLFCIPDGVGEAAYNSNNVGAKGMDSVKDNSLDTITLTFKTPQSQNPFYFSLEDCFACVDWNKNVVVKYAASILSDVTLLYSVKTAVGFARNSKIKTLTFESPIALADIANMLYHSREITTLTINFKNLYAEHNGFPLTDEVVICNYAFCDCSLLYLSWGGDKTIILHPWSVNVFYLSDIEEIASDNIIDLKFINPSVSDSNITNGIQILGSNFKTAKFKNLNMGNWTIDCPLDKNSVIYLLNNVYDLTSNLNGEYVPDDSNMFVHWYYWKNNNGTYRKVYHGEESEFRNGEFVESVDTSDVFGRKRQLRIDNYAGKKTFKWNVFGSNQTVQGYIRIYDANENKLYEKQIDPNQGYYSLDGDITIDFSDYSGASIPVLEIEFQISTSQRDYFYYDIKPSYPGKSEASTITSADIVFTKVIYDSEFDTAIAVAQARGWTIQFAS